MATSGGGGDTPSKRRKGEEGSAEPAAPPKMTVAGPKRVGQLQKWRVIVADTKVRSAVDLKSDEVRLLCLGEIVEQTGDSVTLNNGIIRMPITHPSAAEYPAPIGWVTQPAEAVKGPKYLEHGPQPLGFAGGKGKGWGGDWGGDWGGGWWDYSKGKGKGK